ncbi:MAG TPA: alpha-xylosidase [Chthoniobacteraceae bacterium]|jgi:alpha-D-xyloside xylohydrolase|nr:alpha-xylosidase [Chthoniobacteraceae bacterium]
MSTFNFDAINTPVDVGIDFLKLENTWFLASAMTAFDPATGRGSLEWVRYQRKTRLAFNQLTAPADRADAWEFPPEYGDEQRLPFQIDFISAHTVRLRFQSRAHAAPGEPPLVLAGEPPSGPPWPHEGGGGAVTWRSPAGSMELTMNPWAIEFRDAKGRLLTKTRSLGDTKCLGSAAPTPFAFVRRAADMERRFAAAFTLAPDEGIYGCGESFTRLNKRGQRLDLFTVDAHGVETREMYKPVPFFISSRGYGMFIHSTTPMTLDFGHDYDGAATLYVGDESLDLFFFIGEPRAILSEYTGLTGRSPMPPLWSFGLWMSRITYKSAEETREVADGLRKHRIPSDVIHLDTGWFETDWRCDFEFSPTRFPDAPQMIRELRARGLRVSLWQLPYFTPTNCLYAEAISKGYIVKNSFGAPATEDAILDFSNPDAVAWYQGMLERLLRMGVAAIKVDFGEAAPLDGQYASGARGWVEHNLYPLRYNAAVADVTKRVTGEHIIWARSAWAGSQRYPIHWGGDAENTDCGMASSLRGGLSLGLSGFSYWSHDIGGFVQKSEEALYRRWMPFGMLTSHSRCHGSPPKEPWHFSVAFLEDFRRAVELKYRLMPYVWTQARICSANGWPMVRPLFFEYPEDRGSWLIEDQYLFGSDILVAPLIEETAARLVYLPPGVWIDYQDAKVYHGPGWQEIGAGLIPCVILVKEGSAIPHATVAQCCEEIDWSHLTIVVFTTGSDEAKGHVSIPSISEVHPVTVRRKSGKFELEKNPFGEMVTWTIEEKNPARD